MQNHVSPMRPLVSTFSYCDSSSLIRRYAGTGTEQLPHNRHGVLVLGEMSTR